MSDQVQPIVTHAPLAFTVPTLVLQRVRQTDLATYGTLASATIALPATVTLELAWRANAPDVSCVPAGVYPIVRFRSPHFGYDVFQLEDVPGRSACELHVGNTVADVHGCIALGSNFGVVNGQDGVTGSQAAFARFMTAMRGIDRALLTIRDVPPSLVP